MSAWSQGLRDRRGGVTIVVAMMVMLLCGCLALAIDLGNIFMQSRRLQGVVDLAAMAAARDLGRAEAAATATANLSGWSGPLALTVTKGVYAPNAALAPRQRFQPQAADANAAAVAAKGQVQLYFAGPLFGRSQIDITRSATAARAEVASFSIGSRLASFKGGIANDLLSALTGSTVSLTAMDYDALASAKVDLLTYAETLNSSANLTAATFDKTLDASITPPAALDALADALIRQGDQDAGAAMQKLAAAASGARSIELKSLVSLGPYADKNRPANEATSAIAVDALSMAKAILMLAQEGRQLQLDLDAAVPGVTEVKVWLAIGERPNQSPWLTVTEAGGTVVRTAQTRLYVEATTLGALQGVGIQSLRIPILVEAASAEAALSDIKCPWDRQAQSVTLAVKPSLGNLVLGDIHLAKLNDFKTPLSPSPATLLAIPTVKVQGSADIKLGGTRASDVKFSRSDIDAGAIKTVGSTDIAQSAVASLVGATKLDVTALGLNLGLLQAPLRTSIANQLGQVAAPLDGLITQLTDLLGVGLGEADVKINGLRCNNPALVA